MNVPVLRSVNLRDDIAVPSRLRHYHPTTRSLQVTRAVLSGRATMVIAAYGSGKSLAAGIGAVAVSNREADRKLLRDFAGRISAVDPELAEEYGARATSDAQGRVVVLSGYVRDLAANLSAALGLGTGDTLDRVLKAAAKLQDADRVAIVWDEFGRHLEGLVAEGRARDLDAVQRLAEWAARVSGPTAALTLLLHQNFLAYAGSVNQTTRHEWRKIEGRFEQVRFVEDSRELYGLVAEVMRGNHPDLDRDVPGLPRIAEGVVAARWLDGMDAADEVEALLRKAHPLSAAALQALPGLVARVGQNERSLFAFLEHVDASAAVGMDELYVAFSEAMRSDVGVGGVHRRWLEAESARSKCDDAVEREALAAAFLLQLGAHGERRHLPRATLELAIESKGIPLGRARAAVDALVERKLMLYRKLNDDVSVWHGADIDVASRLRDERMARVDGFHLMAFLAESHPAPFLRPVRHNVRTGTSRYLEGVYVAAADLTSLEDTASGTWGRVVYAVCNTGEDVAQAREFATSADLDRTVLVVPSEPVPVFDAALEIEALSALRRDETFMAEDPLVGQEVDELLAIARRHLSVVMHRLTTDRPAHATWHHRGDVLDVTPERAGGVAASELMDIWYPLTPRIINDQVMRGRLSRQMTTARVRLVTRIMEHAGEAGLGYADDDSSAEASVYRTVLARTGLHVAEGTRGRFADPEEVGDPGLRRAWEIVLSYFTEAGRKPLRDVVDALASPPVGTPAGVIPILVMAGYRAFGRAVTLRTDGAYVGDVLGFDSTRMFVEPDRHEVEVHASDEDTLWYLAEVAYVFTHERPGPHDERVRFAVDAISAWRSGVAHGARRSRRLTDAARSFLKAIDHAEDPATFILQSVPAKLAVGAKGRRKRLGETVRQLEQVRNVVDGLVEGYLRDAVEVVTRGLNLNDKDEDAVRGVQAWVTCLDVDSLMRRPDLKLTDKTILRTARDTINGRYSPESLARAVSSVLLQRGIEKWQDDTGDQLRKELRECRMRIEAAAVEADDPPASLRHIIESRIRQLEQQLERIRMREES